MKTPCRTALLIGVLFLAACKQEDATDRTIGNKEAGRVLIRELGCGSCHRIPGIRSARGLVGPPLDAMGRRTVIAGVLENTPEAMIRWLRDPQAVVPGNAMPDLGLTWDQAANITAYLYSLD